MHADPTYSDTSIFRNGPDDGPNGTLDDLLVDLRTEVLTGLREQHMQERAGGVVWFRGTVGIRRFSIETRNKVAIGRLMVAMGSNLERQGYFSPSLYHPDPLAPANTGRALRVGDTVAYHVIRHYEVDQQPSDARRWQLLTTPEAGASWCPALYTDKHTPNAMEVKLSITAYDRVGLGNLRIVPR